MRDGIATGTLIRSLGFIETFPAGANMSRSTAVVAALTYDRNVSASYGVYDMSVVVAAEDNVDG